MQCPFILINNSVVDTVAIITMEAYLRSALAHPHARCIHKTLPLFRGAEEKCHSANVTEIIVFWHYISQQLALAV